MSDDRASIPIAAAIARAPQRPAAMWEARLSVLAGHLVPHNNAGGVLSLQTQPTAAQVRHHAVWAAA